MGVQSPTEASGVTLSPLGYSWFSGADLSPNASRLRSSFCLCQLAGTQQNTSASLLFCWELKEGLGQLAKVGQRSMSHSIFLKVLRQRREACLRPVTGRGQMSGACVVTEDNVQVNVQQKLSLVSLLLIPVYNGG